MNIDLTWIYTLPMEKSARFFEIVRIVKERQREIEHGYGLIAKNIQPRLGEYRAEQTIRRDMVELWEAGILERCGGGKSRKGYRVALAA